MNHQNKKTRLPLCQLVITFVILSSLFYLIPTDSTQAAGEIFYVRAHTKTPIYSCANPQNPILIRFRNRIFFDPTYVDTILRINGSIKINGEDWYLIYPEKYQNLCVPAKYFTILPEEFFEPINPGVNGTTKRIELDLTEQKLTAYEGDRVVLETPISAGKVMGWTPVGEYTIYFKIRTRHMTGANFDTVGVPLVMFFGPRGQGLHGAPFQDDINLPYGVARSHGCVRLPAQAAEFLYRWTGPVDEGFHIWVAATKNNPGTRVIVHY